ncbi:hypothetical protein Q8F55_004951 [Vanrija albida]|uniref:Choline/carnitine acyltransferase domain-containing protein n=1 Tax=Vanrija albida TaxID=181172 RepID=A0ABR3Q0H9_9TREE
MLAARISARRAALTSTPRTGASLVSRRHKTTETRPGTFDFQAELPRLPIPALQDTAARYLASLEPLLPADEFKRSVAAVNEFISPTGLGPVLQERLQAVDKAAPASWLEDIWLNKAYLEWRGPSYINVNWAAILADNAAVPLVPVSQVERGRPTDVQINRAARLVTHLLEANDALNMGTFAPDQQRDTPLCMNQYKWQFGTTRVPAPGRDQILHQYPSTVRHVLLQYRNTSVAVPVYNEQGKRASTEQIAEQLRAATQAVDAQIAASGPLPAVANLTAADRDLWTAARETLQADAVNKASLDAAESALFGVCLDVDADPATLSDPEANWHTLTHSDAGSNRWFDKAISLVVLPTGRVGVNCEHTPVDALTTGRLLLEAIAKEKRDPRPAAAADGLAPPAVLQWNVSDGVAAQIAEARKSAGALAGDLKLRFGGTPFGAKFIKGLGVSPDAFFQVALQTAYLRHHGRAVATYESASLRRFAHGRTETIRSATSAAQAFARAFDGDASLGEKLGLFKTAAATHTALSHAAAAGQGVDRHLLGLRAQLGADEAATPSLFTDPGYALSSTFVLSTSNTTPGDQFRGGFAPVTADGYGVNYALDPQDIKFSVSEWKSSAATDADAFKATVIQTLNDLHAAGEQAQK